MRWQWRKKHLRVAPRWMQWRFHWSEIVAMPYMGIFQSASPESILARLRRRRQVALGAVWLKTEVPDPPRWEPEPGEDFNGWLSRLCAEYFGGP